METMRINNTRKRGSGVLIMATLFSPLSAFAKGSEGNNALSDVILSITNFITDDIGTALCTLAIIGTGFLWLKSGRIEKEQALGTMLGIGLIYSASYIVTSILHLG